MIFSKIFDITAENQIKLYNITKFYEDVSTIDNIHLCLIPDFSIIIRFYIKHFFW